MFFSAKSNKSKKSRKWEGVSPKIQNFDHFTHKSEKSEFLGVCLLALTFSHFGVGRPNFMRGKCSVSCVQICTVRPKKTFLVEKKYFEKSK